MTCIKCGQPATHHFTTDLDIRGIGSCQACFKEIKLQFHLLLGLGGDELAKQAEKQFERWAQRK